MRTGGELVSRGGAGVAATPGRRPLGLSAALATFDETVGPTRANLLVIDQFEEVFTVCADDQERDQFLGRPPADRARG